jgi:hypothetical protein
VKLKWLVIEQHECEQRSAKEETAMKRDKDLIRLLLLEAEGENVDLSEYDGQEIHYHKHLLIDAGLAVGSTTRVPDPHGSRKLFFAASSIYYLTWDGHDLIANIRDEKVWNETKKTLAEKGADVSIAVLKALAAKISMDLFGLT